MVVKNYRGIVFIILAFGSIFCIDYDNVTEYKRKTNALCTGHDSNCKSSLKNATVVIQKNDIETAIKVAEQLIEKLATFERNIHDYGIHIAKFSPFFGQMADFLPSVEAINNTKNAFVAIKTTQQLAIKFCYKYPKYRECVDKLSNLKLGNTSLGKICSNIYENIVCNDEMAYRSSDEICNNLNNATWGSSNTAYRRLLKPDYDDGLYALRNTSSDGKGLPSPRIISTTLTNSDRITDEMKTQAVAIWGLFIGHDMTHTPASNMVNIKTTITCCTSDGMPLKPRRNHVSCAPIYIPQTDVFYNKFFQSCMNYVRSLPAMRTDCTIGPTEQMNQASHFLDGSVIYGSTKRHARTLRAMTGGRLLTMIEEDGDEYPPTLDEEIPCHSSECVHAGDHRVNSHPQLTILHTLFVREHNRIADELLKMNKHWKDERIYQEARRIVIAEIQHITYAYWLPPILGKNYIKKLGLDISTNVGYSDKYDETLNPSVSNCFATAGLPFINSMIDGHIELYLEDRNISDVNKLRDHFVKSSQTNQTDYFDNVIRGLATQNSEKVDLTFTEALTHYWYTPSGDFGMDLFSLDIQRGRDHGIPSYFHYRKFCNLSEINSFEDLRGIVHQNVINKLRNVYRKVDNIDLVVGLMAEIPTDEAMIGPTLQCIVGEQFVRTKNGDKFFYDNENQPNPFSEAQLEEIRKINLARIFCDNSNNVSRMQNDVFSIPNDDGNQLFDCQGTSIPAINLSFWKDPSK